MSTNNLISITPTTVLPLMFYTKFQESHVYPQLNNSLHDGTQQRGIIRDGTNSPDSLRTWALAVRLRMYTLGDETLSPMAALQQFWVAQNGGLQPFWFYNPLEPGIGETVGSNYDPTGSSAVGRYKVRFSNQSLDTVGSLGLFQEVNFALMEVA